MTFYLIAVYIVEVVNSHICLLQERFDPSSMRWSLPQKERCFCQRVVAPQISGSRSCVRVNDTDNIEDLWFIDDPTTVTNPRNWTPRKLDDLLDRSQCCNILLVLLYLGLMVGGQ